jgi:concentrative nucleoside transporter, CNT family
MQDNQTPDNGPPPSAPAVTSPTTNDSFGKTPLAWRLAIAAALIAIAGIAYLTKDAVGLRGQSVAGVLFFFGVVAMFSRNLRAVNWRTIGWGIAIQLILAVLVLKAKVTVGDTEYSVYAGVERMGDAVKTFMGYANKGAEFVFGNLANPEHMSTAFGKNFLFPFAFVALPPILFVSAFFTVLYHFGILQMCVRAMARVMVHLMRTSGAETLSVAANVFMGQTEAPLIVKPYVPRMTNSELFVLMASGMAHISGSMMAVYINYGANPVAIIATCIMACPCSLYLSKLFMPEISRPETSGKLHAEGMKSPYVNAIDAAASGTSDGLRLALNVGAMLIVFVAFVAFFNGLLGLVPTHWFSWTGAALPEHFSLEWIFGRMFSPVAFLMGVASNDQTNVGTLLGTKLAMNEHVAFLTMKSWKAAGSDIHMSARSYQLAAYALTGFANFASVGIQLGGIGGLAPERRHDLARLGMRALFVGFVATLLNAAVAGAMSDLTQ